MKARLLVFPSRPCPAHCQPLPPGTVSTPIASRKLISRSGLLPGPLARDSEEGSWSSKSIFGCPRHSGRRKSRTQVNPEGQGKFNTGMRSFLEEEAPGPHPSPQCRKRAQFLQGPWDRLSGQRHEEGCSLHEHIVRKAKAGAPIREEFCAASSSVSSPACARSTKQKLLHLDLKPANIFLRRDGNGAPGLRGGPLGSREAQVNLGNIYTLGFAARNNSRPTANWSLDRHLCHRSHALFLLVRRRHASWLPTVALQRRSPSARGGALGTAILTPTA